MTQETLGNKAQGLQAQGVMLEVPVNVKEMKSDFVLITYDLPNTPEGMKARVEFLARARRYGAVQHSETVYFVPWTDQVNYLILNLAEKGKSFIWFANTDGDTKRQLMMHYELTVRGWLKEIEERLDRMSAHLAQGKFGIAERMMDKTLEMVKDMDAIINNGCLPLAGEIKGLKEEFGRVASQVVLTDKKVLGRR